VPLDTLDANPLLVRLMQENLFQEYALQYFRQNRKALLLQKLKGKPENFQLPEGAAGGFFDFVQKKKIAGLQGQKTETQAYISLLLNAGISRILWGEEGYIRVMVPNDKLLQAALRNTGKAKKLFLQSQRQSQ
jgi:hypothetical protein